MWTKKLYKKKKGEKEAWKTQLRLISRVSYWRRSRLKNKKENIQEDSHPYKINHKTKRIEPPLRFPIHRRMNWRVVALLVMGTKKPTTWRPLSLSRAHDKAIAFFDP